MGEGTLSIPAPSERVLRETNRVPYAFINDGLEGEEPQSITSYFSQECDTLESEETATGTPVQSVLTQGAGTSASHSSSSAGTSVSLKSSIGPWDSISQSITSAETSPVLNKRNCAGGLLTSKRRRTNAWLWEQFDREVLGTKWKSTRGKKCETWDVKYTCRHSDENGVRCQWYTKDSVRHGGTSNMVLHLRKRHGLEAPADSTSSTGITKASAHGNRTISECVTESAREKFERNLLVAWIDSSLPFSHIEKPSWRRLIRELPFTDHSVPTREKLKSQIMDYGYMKRDVLRQDLLDTCQTIAVSLDAWTSSHGLSFLGVIGHWLTPEFEYREVILDFKELSGPHTGENMASAVREILQDLNIEDKLISITGDNASNNILMAQLLHDSLKKDGKAHPLFDGEHSYVRCMAHILHLIVMDILSALRYSPGAEGDEVVSECDSRDISPTVERTSGISDPIERLRMLAVWISKSAQRKAEWRNMCKSRGLSDALIPYDVRTRWNSTHRMIAKALEFTDIAGLTPGDWKRLAQIEWVLRTFDELTGFVSVKGPQMHLAVLLYYHLDDALNDAAERIGEYRTLDEDIAQAVSKGIEKHVKYFKIMDNTDIHYLGLVLDPRVKGEAFRNALKDDAEPLIGALKKGLVKRYSPESDKSGNEQPTEAQNPASIEENGAGRAAKLRNKYVCPSGSRASTATSDIDLYFRTPVVPENSEDSSWLLSWWRSHRLDFPDMAKAARDILAIPVSEVSVERSFSTARDVLGVRRTRLDSETLCVLMALATMDLD